MLMERFRVSSQTELSQPSRPELSWVEQRRLKIQSSSSFSFLFFLLFLIELDEQKFAVLCVCVCVPLESLSLSFTRMPSWLADVSLSSFVSVSLLTGTKIKSEDRLFLPDINEKERKKEYDSIEIRLPSRGESSRTEPLGAINQMRTIRSIPSVQAWI